MKSLSLAAVLLACTACVGGTAWGPTAPPRSPDAAGAGDAPTEPPPPAQANRLPPGRRLQSPYPATRHTDQVDTYHGVSVADPYRWLEEDSDEEVMAWTDAQNALTDAALTGMQHRGSLREALRSAWSYPRRTALTRRDGSLFEMRNDGMQTQDVLWVVADGQARALLDPAQLPQNSAASPASLASLDLNHEGTLLAYAVSQAGSDWRTLRVRDVATGRDLDDEVRGTKFNGAAWKRDGSGFFYIHFPQPESNAPHPIDGQAAVYWHALGTAEADDYAVFTHPDPAFSVSAQTSDDGRWLVVSAQKGSGKNELWVQDLANPEASAQRVTDAWQGSNSWIGNDDDAFFLHTTGGAAHGRVLRVPLSGQDGEPVDLIPETDDTLEAVSWVGDRLVAKYLHDAHSLVRLHALDGALAGTLALPAVGSVHGFVGAPHDSVTFYTFQNPTTPPTVMRLDTATGEQTTHFAPQLPVSTDDLITEQVFFPSRDGTRLTAFISRRKDAPRDGDQPTLLYGYGGFNISITPAFNVANLVWMQRGGTYVSAVLRGGGEYGDAWHWAGTQENKQNVFDDFIATAEYLIAEGYTSPKRLAINGASNGGLLVGACMTQRPELFAAAMPEAGVLDMLRFEQFTAGRYWTEDYGTLQKAEDFHAMLAYSPVHNVHADTPYPATLIVTSDHDDRVVPAHSFKFAAALQASQRSGGAPILLRVLHGTGHGAGRGLEQRVELASERLTFLENALRARRTCCHKP